MPSVRRSDITTAGAPRDSPPSAFDQKALLHQRRTHPLRADRRSMVSSAMAPPVPQRALQIVQQLLQERGVARGRPSTTVTVFRRALSSPSAASPRLGSGPPRPPAARSEQSPTGRPQSGQMEPCSVGIDTSGFHGQSARSGVASGTPSRARRRSQRLGRYAWISVMRCGFSRIRSSRERADAIADRQRSARIAEAELHRLVDVRRIGNALLRDVAAGRWRSCEDALGDESWSCRRSSRRACRRRPADPCASWRRRADVSGVDITVMRPVKPNTASTATVRAGSSPCSTAVVVASAPSGVTMHKASAGRVWVRLRSTGGCGRDIINVSSSARISGSFRSSARRSRDAPAAPRHPASARSAPARNGRNLLLSCGPTAPRRGGVRFPADGRKRGSS